MASTDYDLIVIGSGPGGYVAAIRAAQLGMKTAIVERAELGGVCLNWGCIPTKALLRTAEIFRLAKEAGEFGLRIDASGFDMGAVVKRSRDVAGQLSKGVTHLMKKNRIEVVRGEARLEISTPAPKVVVKSEDGETALLASHVILATGARARTIPQAGLEPDGKVVWTYREAMVPDSAPKSMLVIGSGAIGMEFASFYHDLGAEVTVVEMLDRILPAEDEEISAFAKKRFEKQGLKFHLGAQVETLETSGKGAKATVKTGAGKTETIEVERVVLAIGIVGNVEGLGLEDLGVTVEKGHVKIDGYGRTGVDGLYAIGDVCGPPWLAHKASHEGVACVEKIAGKDPHPLDVTGVPACTYCHPQVASIGLTETKAKEAGRKLKVGRFPFVGNGKAIALGEPEGLVKTIFDADTGELLGAHMIGAEVTEMIQGFAIGKSLETTEAELMDTIFPHPTISESMHESVLDAFDRVIHI